MDFDSTFASINEFGGVDYAPHNKGVTPIFFVEAILDEGATEREGRTVYVDKERVRIHIVGDSTAATHPVDAGIIARFRDQYEAWKRKQTGSHINGMPLSKWPISTPGMVRELESLNILSVEDLAAVSDGNIQNLTNGRAMREKAIAWLKSSTDGAAVMKYAAEANRLREEVAELRKMISSLGGNANDSDKHPNPRAAWTAERRAKQAATIAARKPQAAEMGNEA
jgi:hypothetical protein